MVLDGLEDNDDFWNIAPSDDEVPIVDSGQGHLGRVPMGVEPRAHVVLEQITR
jgi:hypothetical protein